MVRESLIDMKRLWELTQEGKNAQEIMQEMHISEVGALKNAIQNLASERGTTINVPGLIGKGSIDENFTDTGEPIPPGMDDKSST